MDAQEDPKEADLLTQCPWCGYSLRGLPLEHVCPECGRSIDRGWAVFRNANAYWRLPLLVLVALGFCLAVPETLGRLPSPELAIGFGLIVVFGLVGTGIQWGRERGDLFVCAGPSSVAIFDRSLGALEAYPTEQIRCARIGPGGMMVLELIDGPVNIESLGGIGSDVRHCVRYINDLSQEVRARRAKQIKL